MYNNEELMLDIRLNYMVEKVEKFIIVESKFDHQGNKKKIEFDIKKFSKYKNKINHLIIDEFPKNFNNWERENFQRNYIEKGLKLASEDDYIMISDVDEIPNLSKIKEIQKNKFTVFEQQNFFYKFNLKNMTIPNWYGTKVCKKKFLKNPQWLRNQKVKKFSIIKFYKIKWNIIKNGGWHFSFLMSPSEIQNKIRSFAHSEYNSEIYTNIDEIKSRVDNNKDLFDRKQNYQKIDIDETFPSYIIKNTDKLKKFIIN